MIDDAVYKSNNPKYHVRASSMNCLVPGSKLYMFKPSDNNETQHCRSDGHKCYNNARMDMYAERKSCCHKNIFIP